ncbi:MAG TPA: hypothetical protein VIQ54_08065 [Polyangia bacterium]|jgi:hypothetical protein
MLKRLALPILLALLVCPQVVRSETPSAPAGDTLSDDEGLTMCAEALPKQLACKEEFCAAMVQIRTKGDKKIDLKAMEAKCLKEIAVDGTGDLATRKDRCAGWIKNRPKMSIKRADAKAMDACWSKSTCKERIDCWSPKMSQMMETAAPKKK